MELTSTSQKYERLALMQSFGFFLLFGSFNASQSLAGSLPAPAGLPPFQFMVLYVAFTLACIPAPKLVVWLGPKLSMVLGGIPYLGIVLSFLSPGLCTDEKTTGCWEASTIWALKLAMGALVGFSAGVIWTGQGVYLAQLAAHAAAAESSSAVNSPDGAHPSGHNEDASKAEALGVMIKRFNGIFFQIFNFSAGVATFAASLVLTLVNSSSAITYLFIGLSACCSGGLLVFSCLPSLPSHGGAERGEGAHADGASLLATLRLCLDPRMYLLCPIILYNGMSLGE